MCDKGHKDMSYHKESDGDCRFDQVLQQQLRWARSAAASHVGLYKQTPYIFDSAGDFVGIFDKDSAMST